MWHTSYLYYWKCFIVSIYFCPLTYVLVLEISIVNTYAESIVAAYPLIDAVQLTKNCSTLRVVPYLWDCFNPPSKDYRPMMLLT